MPPLKGIGANCIANELVCTAISLNISHYRLTYFIQIWCIKRVQIYSVSRILTDAYGYVRLNIPWDKDIFVNINAVLNNSFMKHGRETCHNSRTI